MALPLARRPVVLLLIAVVALLAGCFGPSTSDKDLRWIDAATVTKLLNEKETPTLLIDVRSPQEYAQAHLPGAVNIPLPKIGRRHPRAGEAARVIVYDNSWHDPLAPAAAKKLIALGRSSVLVFRGGVDRWRKRGQPLKQNKQVSPRQVSPDQPAANDNAPADKQAESS